MPSPALDNPQANTGQSPQGWFNSKWYKPLGQLCELLSVIVLVGLMGLFWLPLQNEQIAFIVAIDILVVVGLFLAAVFCLRRAIRESKAAADEAERIASSRNHVISDARLLVLKEEKLPGDAFEVLTKLINSASSSNGVNGKVSSTLVQDDRQPGEVTYTAQRLIAELRKGLGKERTEEVKGVILKYTVKDEESPKESGDSSDQKPTAQPEEPATAAAVPIASHQP